MPEALPMVRLSGPRPRLDARIHLARPDLVEIGLANLVAAARYVAPQPMACTVPCVAMRGVPDGVAVSELLHGEAFDVFDTRGEWALGRTLHDGYLGWVPLAALADREADPTHRITARSAPVFAEADIKSKVLALLPMGSHVRAAQDGRFLVLADGGHVHAAHVAPLPETDLIGTARRFLGAPYVWGGRTPDGVDCSGLVQAALSFCGVAAPRDSDQQREGLGVAITFEARMPGDILFFPGHVGILTAGDRLLHANAHWMACVEEPLADVLARLAEGAVLAVKRLG